MSFIAWIEILSYAERGVQPHDSLNAADDPLVGLRQLPLSSAIPLEALDRTISSVPSRVRAVALRAHGMTPMPMPLNFQYTCISFLRKSAQAT